MNRIADVSKIKRLSRDAEAQVKNMQSVGDIGGVPDSDFERNDVDFRVGSECGPSFGPSLAASFGSQDVAFHAELVAMDEAIEVATTTLRQVLADDGSLKPS